MVDQAPRTILDAVNDCNSSDFSGFFLYPSSSWALAVLALGASTKTKSSTVTYKVLLSPSPLLGDLLLMQHFGGTLW